MRPLRGMAHVQHRVTSTLVILQELCLLAFTEHLEGRDFIVSWQFRPTLKDIAIGRIKAGDTKAFVDTPAASAERQFKGEGCNDSAIPSPERGLEESDGQDTFARW